MKLKLKIKRLLISLLDRLRLLRPVWRFVLYIITFYINNRWMPRGIAMIGLTYFCQCRCSHCAMANYPKDKQRELSKGELMRIISQLSRNKTTEVYFFGGEPLLRSDIFELINYAHQRGLITRLDTNGLLLSQEMAKKLKNAGLDLIGVSIDSPHPKAHNSLRGTEGLFERATEGIKNCLNEKILCFISTYATKENIRNGDLEKIILLGEELRVIGVRILPPLPLGRWSDKKSVQLNHQEHQLLNKIARSSFVQLEGKPCHAVLKKLFYISPYGEVQPCCYIPLTFGNVRKKPLEDTLKKMWTHSMFNMVRKNECPINNKEFQRKYLSRISPASPLLKIKNKSNL